ncbi:tRNA (adenosine(37)-N6)-dimethylallyltransferase MiaA [Candidatus Kaiserbacteria bacterium RIFCSPHIGHO2_02_FULL_49_11]|uniref:tRNA dimethylallyltransferase n=1 Tax=Candidatus Kaiserbacteria bacterium RIFCSPHIGHO2_02_FULL_49_11 TaxID=1798489 RepID=A0A1F6D052_9BACT|nr:MAG: tRNA (adenosine(37)-N6)-dimethylallyltransferase MiaA [Candidatus Kaiserbacteria bacterium RIFCSPHIGHO2_02_FULL_49_11]
MKPGLQKIIVIVGQTASGKSDLAVALAKKYGGEVISADSRQVYRGLNLGTGKITKKEMRGVPHHLLDVADPRRTYSVARYIKDARKKLRYIVIKGKVPIVVGGTGFYIDALLHGTVLPDVRPNAALRKQLQKLSAAQLFQRLQKCDSRRARTIDPHNKVRLIRALEIAKKLGKVPPQKQSRKYNTLMLGISWSDAVLKKRIRERMLKRVQGGMVAEARQLHKGGLSFKRMEELGLEYRYLARYLKGDMSKEQMLTELETKTWQYAKRQKTWFKRNKNIQWFTPSIVEGFSPKDRKKIEKTVALFLAEK